MPSSYTSSLRLEKQAQGENEVLWGDKRNAGIDQTDAAIAGSATLDLSGSGDYALSTQNGATDEARNMMLIGTGVLTGDRKIVIPSVSKQYIVINAATGGFELSIGTAGGNSIVLTSPSVSHFVTDGSTTYLVGFVWNAFITSFVSQEKVRVNNELTVKSDTPRLLLTDDDGGFSITFETGANGSDFNLLKGTTRMFSVDDGFVYRGDYGSRIQMVDEEQFQVTGNSYKVPGVSRFVQWGVETVAANSNKVFTFPQEFGGVSNIAIVAGIQDGPLGGTVEAPTAVVLSTTQAQLYNPNAQTYQISWQAMGR